jgi:putative tricarboxylic transport membrane protein
VFENALANLLELFIWPGIIYLFAGALIGTIFGILPGLGGVQLVALLTPLTFAMEPSNAIILLISAMAAGATGGAITSILINTPGDPSNAATTFDGYPLAKQGKADMALGASATASMLGGVFGALILTLILPAGRYIILALSYPEYFMMAIMGLSIIIALSQDSLWKGIISAGIGFMAGSFGYHPITGDIRFSFGSVYLYDGIKIAPVLIGIFAISEALTLFKEKESIMSSNVKMETSYSGVMAGVKSVFTNFGTFIRGSIIGTIIGIIPGVGGTVASFLAYGSTVQSAKNKEMFGKGDIRGVIGPEAANNAKDGGSLVPTLIFGIPGSAQMAVFIGALMVHGIQPGPRMMLETPSLALTMVYVLVLSNIIVGVLSLVNASMLSKLTLVSPNYIVPFIIILSLVGTYATDRLFGDLVVALIFGLIGFFMKEYGFSRITFLLALVLGKMMEDSFHQTLISMGPQGFVNRPISLIMFVLTLFFFFWPFYQNRRKTRRNLIKPERGEAC